MLLQQASHTPSFGGFGVKQPLNLDHHDSVDDFNRQNNMAHDLLEELHSSYYPPEFHRESQTDESVRSIEEWLRNSHGMVEPISYGEEGAYDFQYLDFALKRYEEDRQWIRDYSGTTLESVVEIAKKLRQLTNERASNFAIRDPLEETYHEFLSIFLFQIDDLQDFAHEEVIAFLRAFSLWPGMEDESLGTLGGRNLVHERPIIRLEDRTFLFPVQFYLYKSIYESPIYWMRTDKSYKDIADHNRGVATEKICSELLQKVFEAKNVYRNVKIKYRREDFTEIDVLAIKGNKALIVQAKSKKLTVKSRTGDGPSLVKDFLAAVQSAYDQALRSRTAVTNGTFELMDKEGNAIRLEQTIDEAYIVCVTGDHYPVLPLQAAVYLQKKDGDPYPVTMSMFDFDVLSFYLNDPFELLYYLRQRTRYANNFSSVSEKALLGFHLMCNLVPRNESERIVIEQDVAQFIDASFPVARGHWPKTKASTKLICQWENEAFVDLVNTVKGMGQAGLTDAIFFLYDLAGNRGDALIDGMEKVKRATLRDEEIHDFSIPMPGDGRGISFVSFPEPLNHVEAQGFLAHLERFALARKYKSYADEWLTFGYMAGSSNIVDGALYSRDKWTSDDQLDEMVKELFGTGRVVNVSGRRLRRKPTRNQPCPCGSQLKYKRCHGR